MAKTRPFNYLLSRIFVEADADLLDEALMRVAYMQPSYVFSRYHDAESDITSKEVDLADYERDVIIWKWQILDGVLYGAFDNNLTEKAFGEASLSQKVGSLVLLHHSDLKPLIHVPLESPITLDGTPHLILTPQVPPGLLRLDVAGATDYYEES